MAAAQVIEPARINPFIIKAAAICRLGIKKLYVKINQARSFREFLLKCLHKQVLAVFRSFTIRGACPQRIEINLRIDLETILIHATVQVDRQLRNPEKFFATEQFRLESRATSIHVSKHTCIAKVTIEPARVKRRTVDLRMERAYACIYDIRIRGNLERREVRMRKSDLELRLVTPLLGCTERNDRSFAAHEIGFCRLKIGT